MEAIGKFFSGIILLALNAILTGLLISKFWGWFVLNIFTELPRIGVGQGIGLSFFMALFVIGVAKDSDVKKLAGEKQSFWEDVSAASSACCSCCYSAGSFTCASNRLNAQI